MALALVGQARGDAAAAAAEQQARLRQVHALKQLGQSKVGFEAQFQGYDFGCCLCFRVQ
jgi:hypothetical protein